MRARSLDELYYIYDPYLRTYLQDKTLSDFMFMDTQSCYQEFLDSRLTSEIPSSLTASIRIFNRALRDRFPTMETKHLSKDGRNIYVWVLKGE